MASPASRTVAPPGRKAMILEAATELFRKYGYGGVGVEDIAAAAEITASGLYRHYRNKQAILAAVLEQGAQGMLDDTRRLIDSARTPSAALTAIMELSIERVVEDRVLVAAYYEARHLPEPQHRRFRTLQRRLTDLHAGVVGRVRPDLTPAEARLVVLGLGSLIEVVGHVDEKVDRARLKRMLLDMCMGALTDGRRA